jgi:hypothetical protein
MVNKGWVNDERMSAKSKGILLYFLSLPDDWVIHETEIVKHFSDGKESIRTGIKELIKLGYITKFQNRQENGNFGELTYDVHEVSTVNRF